MIQGNGPFCDDCFGERACSLCAGDGHVPALRDAAGNLDFISGRPTGEHIECQVCQGEGYVR
ncbi:hypothetical protein ACJ4V0_15760 [Phreatobacter sp. HK31-P]